VLLSLSKLKFARSVLLSLSELKFARGMLLSLCELKFARGALLSAGFVMCCLVVPVDDETNPQAEG